MNVKVKLFGVVLVALVAVGNANAMPAGAEVVHDFESEAQKIIVTGQQIGSVSFRMETTESVVTCTTSKLNGTEQFSEASRSEKLTVQATFEGCTFNGFSATIDNEGCNYILTGTTDGMGHAKVEVECPKGGEINLTLTGCTISVGPQTLEQGAHYTKTGSGATRDIDAKITATGGTYTSEGIFCNPFVGNGKDLAMIGEYTIKAYEDKEKVEGAQLGFTIRETVV